MTSTAPDSSTRRSRAARAVAWVFQVLGAALFVFFGSGKVTGSNLAAVDTFDQIGLGQWLRVVIGCLELLGAIGLLLPLTAGLAAACLAALVVGAMGVELFVVADGRIRAPLLCFVVVMVVVVLRRRSISAPVTFVRRVASGAVLRPGTPSRPSP